MSYAQKAERRVERRRGWSLARRDALFGYLFISPQVLGFLVFVVGPIVAVFVFSLSERNLLTGQSTFVGLENYAWMFTADPVFRKVLVNSLVFTAGLVPLNIVLALVLALLLSRRRPGVTLFRTLFFAPVVTSAVAWAIVWRFMLQNESGTINQLLQLAGIDGPNWLREENWAMASVIVTRVLKNVGLNMIIYLAAIQGIPREYGDAARVDGANGWHVLRHVTIPMLAPTTLLITIITIVGSMQVFDHILLMTGGGPANATMVLVYYIYQQGFEFFATGYASSLSVILFIVTLGLTLAHWLLRGRER
ncbi:MAG: sugar ABC transporter permease [Trueperaceae bacterium]